MGRPKKTTPSTPIPRQIIGISLSPEMAAEVKMEAARRGMRVKKLFVEMWAAYKKSKR